jgi:hypothetical protein
VLRLHRSLLLLRLGRADSHGQHGVGWGRCAGSLQISQGDVHRSTDRGCLSAESVVPARLQQENLESVAEFKEEMEAFSQVLARVDEHNAIRSVIHNQALSLLICFAAVVELCSRFALCLDARSIRLSAEIADSSNMVKTLVRLVLIPSPALLVFRSPPPHATARE